MTNLPKTPRSILLVFGLITSGCHVLSIPAYPMDGLGAQAASDACDDSCPPDWLSPLPRREFVGWPVPKWWADWKARKDLPEPPAYPRFHPLPTRPMFQPRPVSGNNHWGGSPPPPPYGKLPDTQMGRDAWESAPAPPLLPGQK